MNERALAWYPVPGINDSFGSISFSYETRPSGGSRSVLIIMNGKRKLCMNSTRQFAASGVHFLGAQFQFIVEETPDAAGLPTINEQ
jgi:hypothetical protein